MDEIYTLSKGKSKKQMNLAKKIASISDEIRDKIIKDYLQESYVIYLDKLKDWIELNKIDRGISGKGKNISNSVIHDYKNTLIMQKPKFSYLPSKEQLLKLIMKAADVKTKKSK